MPVEVRSHTVMNMAVPSTACVVPEKTRVPGWRSQDANNNINHTFMSLGPWRLLLILQPFTVFFCFCVLSPSVRNNGTSVEKSRSVSTKAVQVTPIKNWCVRLKNKSCHSWLAEEDNAVSWWQQMRLQSPPFGLPLSVQSCCFYFRPLARGKLSKF